MSRRRPLPPKPFGFRRNLAGESLVELNGVHFMTVANLEGADRLAALLNDAADLAARWGLISGDEAFSKQKIAHAVATMMGHRLEWSPRPQEDEVAA